METAWVIGNSDDLIGMRWVPMLALSLVLHLSVFSVILFIPGSIPSGRIRGVIYEVNLVEMPSGTTLKKQGVGSGVDKTGVDKKGKTVAKRNTRAKRIQGLRKEEKPVVIAKRTSKKPTTKVKVSPSKQIDKAIAELKKKYKSDESSIRLERAISSLERKFGGRNGSDIGKGGTITGIPIMLYQIEVENWVKSNWSYPVAVQEKKLEAIVILKVKQDGSILNSRFEKRSTDTIFDQSVLKAIDRSNPLPPFPEGYRRSYDEIEINFNLKDLEDY